MDIRTGLINELHNNYGGSVSRVEIAQRVDSLNKELSGEVYDENEQINDEFLELYDQLSEIIDAELTR